MDEQHVNKLLKSKYIAKLITKCNANNLWAFNRHSITVGIAVGLGCSWIPLPFHSIIATCIAIILDCNITIVIAAIWFANPVTMPIMYYVAYRTGEILLQIHPPQVIKFHLSIRDVMTDLHEVWQPFLLGCLVYGLLFACAGYYISNAIYGIKARSAK